MMLGRLKVRVFPIFSYCITESQAYGDVVKHSLLCIDTSDAVLSCVMSGMLYVSYRFIFL